MMHFDRRYQSLAGVLTFVAVLGGVLAVIVLELTSQSFAQVGGITPPGNGRATGPMAVNIYTHMDGGNDGDALSPAIAGNSTHSTSSITWTTPGRTNAYFVDDNPCGGNAAPKALPSPVSVNGVTYNGATTSKAWQRNLTVPAASAKTVQGSLRTGSQILVDSFDLCVFVHVNDGANYSYNTTNINGSGRTPSTYAAIQVNDPSGAGSSIVRAHCEGALGKDINISDNTWYRIKTLYDSTSGTCVMHAYLRSTMAELRGSPTTGGIVDVGNSVTIILYDVNNSTGADGKKIWMKNRVTCWTGACAKATAADYTNLVP